MAKKKKKSNPPAKKALRAGRSLKKRSKKKSKKGGRHAVSSKKGKRSKRNHGKPKKSARKHGRAKKTLRKKKRIRAGSTRTFQLDRDFKRKGRFQYEIKEITVAKDNPRLGILRGDTLEINKYTFTFERPKKFREGQRIDLRDAATRKASRIFKKHGSGAYFARAGFSMTIRTDEGRQEVKRWFPIARRECHDLADLVQYIRDFFLSFQFAMKHYVMETDERSFTFTDFDLEYFPLS